MYMLRDVDNILHIHVIMKLYIYCVAFYKQNNIHYSNGNN